MSAKVIRCFVKRWVGVECSKVRVRTVGPGGKRYNRWGEGKYERLRNHLEGEEDRRRRRQ